MKPDRNGIKETILTLARGFNERWSTGDSSNGQYSKKALHERPYKDSIRIELTNNWGVV